MKFRNLPIAFLLLCILHSYTSSAKPIVYSNDCYSQLKKAFEGEANKQRTILASGKAWHLKYTVTTTFLNPETKQQQTQSTTEEVIASTKYRYTKTENAEVYVNTHDVFSIDKKRNVITHFLSKPSMLSIKNEGFTKLLEDSMVKQFDVTSCAELPNNKNVIRYELSAKNNLCQYLSIVFDINTEKHNVASIKAIFNPKYSKEIQQVDMIIEQEDEMNADPSWNNLHNKFLDNNGHLKKPYDSYHLKEYKNK